MGRLRIGIARFSLLEMGPHFVVQAVLSALCSSNDHLSLLNGWSHFIHLCFAWLCVRVCVCVCVYIYAFIYLNPDFHYVPLSGLELTTCRLG